MLTAKSISSHQNSLPSWLSLKGRCSPEKVLNTLSGFCATSGLELTYDSYAGEVISAQIKTEKEHIIVHWKKSHWLGSHTQRHLHVNDELVELLILFNSTDQSQMDVVDRLKSVLSLSLDAYSEAELAELDRSMPLLSIFSSGLGRTLSGWAIIFRDHFVEHSLGFLRALIKTGVDPQWIYAFDKGDKTLNRHRIRSSLVAAGVNTGVFDNTLLDAATAHSESLAFARKNIDDFIDRARANNRKILVIDDGGLITCGYGSTKNPRSVDVAIELTMSGLKRIDATSDLDIPVFNLAQSQLKQILAYPEIADSCLRRLRAILPGFKLIGQHVIVLGYGALGEKLANALRNLGVQVHIVDVNILRLIQAAERGFSTFRSLRDALQSVKPFLIAGTTGDIALRPEDLPLLSDGVYLAPFATKDFSVLTTHHFPLEFELIPEVGKRYNLDLNRFVTVLGDGRSLNLFESDNIANQGYDAYRAGTLLVADYACSQLQSLNPGLALSLVDTVIRGSGLFEKYYDLYLKISNPSSIHHSLHSVIVGYGVAGRLHARILASEGAKISIVDPKFQGLPGIDQTSTIADLANSSTNPVDFWSVCTPTEEHISSVREILTIDPSAKILLEKPACQAHELNELKDIIRMHPTASIRVVDQYSHAKVIDTVLHLINRHEPNATMKSIEITFNKDRSDDIIHGRFIDRSYGVLGYEWLHMLSILKKLTGKNFDEYLAQTLSSSAFDPVYHPVLFMSSLTEKTRCEFQTSGICDITLHSDILQPHIKNSTTNTPPQNSNLWRKNRRSSDDRHRKIILKAGSISAEILLDPVTTFGGWQLPRNHHRILLEQNGEILIDEIFIDSPMHNALRSAISEITVPNESPPIYLEPLERISRLSEYFRTKQTIS